MIRQPLDFRTDVFVCVLCCCRFLDTTLLDWIFEWTCLCVFYVVAVFLDTALLDRRAVT